MLGITPEHPTHLSLSLPYSAAFCDFFPVQTSQTSILTRGCMHRIRDREELSPQWVPAGPAHRDNSDSEGRHPNPSSEGKDRTTCPKGTFL